MSEIVVQPIGVLHSCYPEKFGIPRQPGLVPAATATLELYEPFARPEMYTGLEDFSHIWVQFVFHRTKSWKPTVRPPRLGGQKRVGVFASRSPHRPNHLGLSVVKLIGLRQEKSALFLDLAEIDILDKTPVVDIKPYIPYSDIKDDATAGYTTDGFPHVAVAMSEEVVQFCATYRKRRSNNLQALIEQTLQQDPRPASQRKVDDREYGMLLFDVNIRWRVVAEGFLVTSCQLVTTGETFF